LPPLGGEGYSVGCRRRSKLYPEYSWRVAK
jgi:hypothetical protein